MKLVICDVHLPLRHPFTIALGTTTVQHNIIVELSADGITGYGETAGGEAWEEFTPEGFDLLPEGAWQVAGGCSDEGAKTTGISVASYRTPDGVLAGPLIRAIIYWGLSAHHELFAPTGQRNKARGCIADEEGRIARRTDEAMRARAAAAWQGGMDGVATFNIFNPGWALWRQLGDPATLLGQEKHYFASVRGIVKSNGGNLPFGPFQKVETLNPSNPKEIAAGQSQTSNIKLGALDPKAKRTIRLRFKEAPAPASLKVTIGNTTLGGWTVSGNWMEAPVENALAAGSNAVTLSLASGQPAPILWMDLMVREKLND